MGSGDGTRLDPESGVVVQNAAAAGSRVGRGEVGESFDPHPTTVARCLPGATYSPHSSSNYRHCPSTPPGVAAGVVAPSLGHSVSENPLYVENVHFCTHLFFFGSLLFVKNIG